MLVIASLEHLLFFMLLSSEIEWQTNLNLVPFFVAVKLEHNRKQFDLVCFFSENKSTLLFLFKGNDLISIFTTHYSCCPVEYGLLSIYIQHFEYIVLAKRFLVVFAAQKIVCAIGEHRNEFYNDVEVFSDPSFYNKNFWPFFVAKIEEKKRTSIKR